jgi:hypothetical protein
MAGASLMEAQARYTCRYRMGSRRLVMFCGDGVADPRGDFDAMDGHVARLEQATGRALRSRNYWVRGRS